MIILAIESSCDDTCVAILKDKEPNIDKNYMCNFHQLHTYT